MRRQRQEQQQARGDSIPAPVGGWNAKDPLAAMPREDAVLLDNWIPRPGYIEIRRGFIAHIASTALGPESLLVWRGGTEDADRTFAVAGGSIYNVSASGALPAASVTGLSNDRWQYVNFANDAGKFLLAFNGVDTPRKYDGSTWGAMSISGSGLTPANLIDCAVHKRRLMMVEKESLRIWYLDTDAIAGTAGLLDLGPVFDKGGVITCIGTWTIDGGQGADDMLVAITNLGQVAIYQGTDPADANNWALVGVYEIGAPLGRRALLKYGAELIVLTSDGAIPLSQALKLNRAEQKNIAITAKIQNAFAIAARSYAANNGWEGILYPAGQLAIFNVPITASTAHQYVQNVQTGAWCRFTGINAQCWAYANGNLYFGGVNGIYRWDTGSSDNGTAITCDVTTAFSGFGAKHRLKQFTMIRPIIRGPQAATPAVDILTEYRTGVPQNTPDVQVLPSAGVWGTGLWGRALWTSALSLRLYWTDATALGYVGAARMRYVANTALTAGAYPEVRVQLIGFDIMYLPGGMI
jgi:hypothetical protein